MHLSCTLDAIAGRRNPRKGVKKRGLVFEDKVDGVGPCFVCLHRGLRIRFYQRLKRHHRISIANFTGILIDKMLIYTVY
jgi:hypothetical protein